MSSMRADLDLGLLSMRHTSGEIYMVEDVEREAGEYWCHQVYAHAVDTVYGVNAVEIMEIEWVEYGHPAQGFIQ